MAIWDAIKIFFATLFNKRVAERVRGLLKEGAEQPVQAVQGPSAGPAPIAEERRPAPKPPREKLRKSEALILLEALQREARLIDFLMEDLSQYSDAQIGAAVRDIHRDCRAVLERMFAIRPLVETPEGVSTELPADFDSGRYRLLGNVSGSGPYRGTVVHHGWQATKCELPMWQGSKDSMLVIAPAEVQVSPQ